MTRSKTQVSNGLEQFKMTQVAYYDENSTISLASAQSKAVKKNQFKNVTKIRKSPTHYLIWFTVLLSLVLPIMAHSATLSSTVNRNQVSTNETLTLVVAIDQQVDSSELNLSPLQQDFEIRKFLKKKLKQE